jgi:hypothetical protein
LCTSLVVTFGAAGEGSFEFLTFWTDVEGGIFILHEAFFQH